MKLSVSILFVTSLCVLRLSCTSSFQEDTAMPIVDSSVPDINPSVSDSSTSDVSILTSDVGIPHNPTHLPPDPQLDLSPIAPDTGPFVSVTDIVTWDDQGNPHLTDGGSPTPPLFLCCTYGSDAYWHYALGYRPSSRSDVAIQYPHAYDSRAGRMCRYDSEVTEPCLFSSLLGHHALDGSVSYTSETVAIETESYTEAGGYVQQVDSPEASTKEYYGHWWYDGLSTRCDTSNLWGAAPIGSECYLKDIDCYGRITKCDPCQVYGQPCSSSDQ